MSHVTSIILTCDLDDGDDAIAKLNKYLTEHNQGTFLQVEKCGGHKAMQVDVFVGAFNYLDHDEFAEVLKSAAFEYPESVTLIVNGESDDGMGAVTLNKATGNRWAAEEFEKKFRELGETPETPFDYGNATELQRDEV